MEAAVTSASRTGLSTVLNWIAPLGSRHTYTCSAAAAGVTIARLQSNANAVAASAMADAMTDSCAVFIARYGTQETYQRRQAVDVRAHETYLVQSAVILTHQVSLRRARPRCPKIGRAHV